MSNLPVEHAQHKEGGALCGAKRKWGALTTHKPEDTNCKKCRAILVKATQIHDAFVVASCDKIRALADETVVAIGRLDGHPERIKSALGGWYYSVRVELAGLVEAHLPWRGRGEAQRKRRVAIGDAIALHPEYLALLADLRSLGLVEGSTATTTRKISRPAPPVPDPGPTSTSLTVNTLRVLDFMIPVLPRVPKALLCDRIVEILPGYGMGGVEIVDEWTGARGSVTRINGDRTVDVWCLDGRGEVSMRGLLLRTIGMRRIPAPYRD